MNKKASVNRKYKVTQSEKIANDFLLQFAYAIASSILLLYIYNASLFRYGGALGSAMPKILWALFGVSAAVGALYIALWKKQSRNGYKVAAIYFFVTAAGFFWCVALQPIFYYLTRFMPFIKYLANTKRLIEMLFILIGLSLIVEIAVYLYRMKNLKNKKIKKRK
ncbi:MAG: hypothetical protein M0R40_05485 [Firmicutes bacterium]|nr:hypothetical protein [Bacillota bacterium]